MTLAEEYKRLKADLRAAGIPSPDLEVRMILRHVTGYPDAAILSPDKIMLTPGQVGESQSILSRRLTGEPLSRIFGEREFWGLPFKLSPETLDPRPDTEMLIDIALQRFTGNAPEQILDICTGSGCILITLLHEWRQSRGIGTDLSTGALEAARENARINGVADRADFIETSWAAGITGKFSLILSNPPYIPSGDIKDLDVAVRNHDPILALDGGKDGLDAYRPIIRETKSLLAPGGIVLLEIGYDQGETVPRLVAEYGATPKAVIPDLTGNPRVVEYEWG